MNIRLVYQAFSTAALLLVTSGAFFCQTVFAADFKPTPLIVDDDGSQDGMTALAYMLANPKFDIQAITIAQGIARPASFVNNLERMLGRLKVSGIPVGIGKADPLAGNNAFPEFIRDGAETFWSPFVQLPDTAPPVERRSAAELIVEKIKQSPQPVAILATGSSGKTHLNYS
ncbi:MAG: nucleoside hydrolase [Nostoc sp.]|uniref:nucleoside hydrolase n=1 Tax=Nostoc sp. TaxID=1180 RepID=UPI002FF95904